jgi:hypothetical protein
MWVALTLTLSHRERELFGFLPLLRERAGVRAGL